MRWGGSIDRERAQKTRHVLRRSYGPVRSLHTATRIKSVQPVRVQSDAHDAINTVESAHHPIIGAPRFAVKCAEMTELHTCQFLRRCVRSTPRTSATPANLHQLHGSVDRLGITSH